MKRKMFFGILLLSGLMIALDGRSQDKPAPSPAGSVSTKVGLTEVKVEYSRPKMNGRKIFGEGKDNLVPFGKLWRTGANSGSVVTFDKDVLVQGKEVPAGSYLLLSKPGKDNWEMMLYSDVTMGGYLNKFDKKNVTASYKVSPQKRTETVETFTINIADISEDSMSAALEIAWENTAVRLNITAK